MNPIDNAGKITVSVATLIMFVVYVVFIFTHAIPPELHDIVQQINTALIGWVGLVIGYWVGSSVGSASKDRTINQQLSGTGNGAPPATPPAVPAP